MSKKYDMRDQTSEFILLINDFSYSISWFVIFLYHWHHFFVLVFFAMFQLSYVFFRVWKFWINLNFISQVSLLYVCLRFFLELSFSLHRFHYLRLNILSHCRILQAHRWVFEFCAERISLKKRSASFSKEVKWHRSLQKENIFCASILYFESSSNTFFVCCSMI